MGQYLSILLLFLLAAPACSTEPGGDADAAALDASDASTHDDAAPEADASDGGEVRDATDGDAAPLDAAAPDAAPWDAGDLGPWHLPEGAAVSLAPRAADGTISGVYTSPLGIAPVEFRVHATGPESAEAIYTYDEMRYTVHVLDATHAFVVIDDADEFPIDGYGALSQFESTYLFALGLPPIAWAARDVPLELACSPGFLAVEIQALILPWQLALKYFPQDRADQLTTALESTRCGWFIDPLDPDPEPRPEGNHLQFSWSTPVPHVIQFFPFDAEGAHESPTFKDLPPGVVCVLPNSADDSAKGVCGAMCEGSCGGWCSAASCTKTEVYPPDCCTTPIGNPLPYASQRVIYTCEVDADCSNLSNCYDNCSNAHGCSTWAAFSCRHSLNDPNSCDQRMCTTYGLTRCLRWMTGTGEHTTTKLYKYHAEPVDDPRCAPSCVPGHTPVSLASGAHVPIEDVLVGDALAAVELDALTPSTALVEGVLVHRDGPYVLDRLVSDEGDELDVTPSHPIWTIDRGFVPASELAPGDLLVRVDAHTGVPETVQLVAILRAASETDVVYNLKTTREHYVAADLVIHNKCLARGTLVDGPDGARPIEALAPGDLVWGTSDGRRVITKITRTFEKRTALDALPGRTLAPGLTVTEEHLVPTELGDLPAKLLETDVQRIWGPVYDLATESGDYLARGVRLRAAR
ncbi:Hint domain-containing protein [Myxococcota bacterium]|nr:Hint domain-containing protein [Myxococcota bacterium]